MKRHSLLLVLALMSLFADSALAGAEQDVNQIEDRRYQVMMAGDLDGLASILADEFVYHQPTGKIATKAIYIDQLKSGEVKWVPGGYTHTLTNVNKQPGKFVTIEFP